MADEDIRRGWRAARQVGYRYALSLLDEAERRELLKELWNELTIDQAVSDLTTYLGILQDAQPPTLSPEALRSLGTAAFNLAYLYDQRNSRVRLGAYGAPRVVGEVSEQDLRAVVTAYNLQRMAGLPRVARSGRHEWPTYQEHYAVIRELNRRGLNVEYP